MNEQTDDLDVLEDAMAHAHNEVRRTVEQLFCALLIRDEALRVRGNDAHNASQLLAELETEFYASKGEFKRLSDALTMNENKNNSSGVKDEKNLGDTS
mmetsp:Transcript_10159/g.15333  ORF Transcript_10159/g.15333 Transcript_10159/m.15333 type:complete len:98 (+) Transcript_10159:126-419(+)